MPRGRKPGFGQRTAGAVLPCSKCKALLPSAAFRTYEGAAGNVYLRSACRTCEHQSPTLRKAIRRWQAKHRGHMNAVRRAWAKANPDKPRQHRRDWVANNRALYNARRSVRRRRGDLTLAQWRAVVAAYDGLCAYCGAPYQVVEHVIPISRGGPNAVGNVVPACNSCNVRKGKKTAQEWIGPTPSGTAPLLLVA